jgi:hypothetical protein
VYVCVRVYDVVTCCVACACLWVRSRSPRMAIKQFVIVGRKKPNAADPSPKIYKMKLFATNPVLAKSRFFYFMSQLKRVKRANGEVLSVQEV